MKKALLSVRPACTSMATRKHIWVKQQLTVIIIQEAFARLWLFISQEVDVRQGCYITTD